MLKWFREHATEFEGDLRFSESLAPFTYYKLGGPADILATPKLIHDLEWLSQGVRQSNIPLFIMGAGSNVLVSDKGFRGLVIRTAKLNQEIEFLNPTRIRVGASVAISTLLRRAAQNGWSGLEFLTGVPGTIGGVVAMNAGTHIGETKDRLKKVEAFSLSGGSAGLHTFEEKDLKYAYRKNFFLPEGAVVCSTEWRIIPSEPGVVKSAIDAMLARRKDSQPIELPSCGSVFKNPKASGLHAWQVIEKLGMRGYRLGGAEFSSKHCNFIVNHGDAKASEVYELIRLAKKRALDELSITLEEEVKYVGSFI